MFNLPRTYYNCLMLEYVNLFAWVRKAEASYLYSLLKVKPSERTVLYSAYIAYQI